jgi:hypothetical protein
VLDPVAGEDLHAPVIHVDREVHGQLAARLAQDAAQAGIEAEHLGGQIELPLGNLPGVDGRRCVLRRHERMVLVVGAVDAAPERLSRLPDDPTGARGESGWNCRPRDVARRLCIPSIAAGHVHPPAGRHPIATSPSL